MNGFGVIAKLTDHFRKYTGSASNEVVFVVHGSKAKHRIATVKPDGNRTVVTLVETK